MRPKVVFDTTVIISAVGWKGKPLACLELAQTGAVVGVTCPELLAELSEKLQAKLNFTAQKADETITGLRTFLQVVTISGQLKAIATDPDDDMVLECACQANATHIVTGDRRHLLPLGSFQGIPIVTVADFLAAITPP